MMLDEIMNQDQGFEYAASRAPERGTSSKFDKIGIIDGKLKLKFILVSESGFGDSDICMKGFGDGSSCIFQHVAIKF
jgi:hypothetical protein